MPHIIPAFTFPAPGEHDRVRRMSGIGSLPLVGKNKPMVDISLKDSQSKTFVPSYTTLEKIQGEVTIVCPTDVKYQNLHILFQGATKTYVEKIATHAPTTPRTQAFHNFLRLSQPMENAGLPEDGILKANTTYKFPFTFVVPEKLLPQACMHKADNPLIQDAHLQLPPSLGDPMMASDGKTLMDDLAPAMTMISYAVRVVLTKPAKDENSKPGVVCDSMKKVRIVPATEELPPLRISDNNEDDYVTTRSKTLKKGMFKGKHGTLTVSARQPAPLRLPYLGSRSDNSRVTTMATVNVRFDPADAKAKPPKLGSLWARLKVATFYATTPMRDFPGKSSHYLYDSQRGIFVETLPLSSRCIASASWTKHEPLPRRDSAISISGDLPSSPPPLSPSSTSTRSSSSASSDSPPPISSSATEAFPYYMAQILVPIDLPTHAKSFVPTFHSCLISRIYALDMNVSAHTPSKAGGTANLHIKIPIQIASEGNKDARPLISPEEAASIARREADNAFVPRSIAPPSEPPPGIDDQHFGATTGRGANLETRGARGSIFVSPSWESRAAAAAAVENAGGMRSPGALGMAFDGLLRRGSEPIGTSVREEEDEVGAGLEDRPPEYTAFSGISARTSGSVAA